MEEDTLFHNLNRCECGEYPYLHFSIQDNGVFMIKCSKCGRYSLPSNNRTAEEEWQDGNIFRDSQREYLLKRLKLELQYLSF